eukprot:2674037-Rhodomonas_salina.2
MATLLISETVAFCSDFGGCPVRISRVLQLRSPDPDWRLTSSMLIISCHFVSGDQCAAMKPLGSWMGLDSANGRAVLTVKVSCQLCTTSTRDV